MLNRGFSLVRKQNGEIVRQANQTKDGEILEILLSQGKLTVKVENIAHDWKD